MLLYFLHLYFDNFDRRLHFPFDHWLLMLDLFQRRNVLYVHDLYLLERLRDSGHMEVPLSNLHDYHFRPFLYLVPNPMNLLPWYYHHLVPFLIYPFH